ncbi:MAG TPA: T9SS type B sorting domain-containing protein, partial [Chitinophaga sp.]
LAPPEPMLQVKDTTVCAPMTVDITSAAIIINRDEGPEFVLSYWADASTTIPLPNPQVVNQSGTYYIKLTNTVTTCEITDPVQVTIHSQPALTLQATPPSCAGSSDGNITPAVSNGAAPYQYSSDGGLTWQNSLAGNLPAGTYTIMVRDGYSCMSQPVSVTLTDPPLLTLREETAGHIDASCYGEESGQLQFSASGGTNDYLYTITSTATGAINNNTGTFTGLPAGAYTVTVTDATQCSSTMEAVILAPPQLNVALVSKTDLECDAQPKGRITLTASGGKPPYWFAIGDGGWQRDSTFTGLGPGKYSIVVRDENNCLTEVLRTEIFVVESCDIIFPSAFTPNGDGLNDLFRPKFYRYVTNYRLSVYNRWGAIIFQVNDPSIGWDGRFKGVLSDTGTFLWIATFVNRHGQPQTLKGTVTLVK